MVKYICDICGKEATTNINIRKCPVNGKQKDFCRSCSRSFRDFEEKLEKEISDFADGLYDKLFESIKKRTLK